MRDRFAEDLRAEAHRLGFEGVGICSSEPSHHTPVYERWLRKSHHGEMAYLARPDSVARRADLRGTMETVRSVVVVRHNYFQADPPGVPGSGIPEGLVPSSPVVSSIPSTLGNSGKSSSPVTA